MRFHVLGCGVRGLRLCAWWVRWVRVARLGLRLCVLGPEDACGCVCAVRKMDAG